MTILNSVEVAAMLRISKKTVLELAQKKKLPCRKVGREWRFVKEEVEKWMVSR